ncbi:hypothetical protein, partial [Nocardia sp. NPDC058497]|uniref:hypothetical protein n=1 Tax=Nocardia sp. NPDC058497 TaxID=3346529 RepID=UPI00364FF596
MASLAHRADHVGATVGRLQFRRDLGAPPTGSRPGVVGSRLRRIGLPTSGAVSYTQITLPTNIYVYISVVALSIKNG